MDVWAELDGTPVAPGGFAGSSIDETLAQLEAWFAMTPEAEISVQVRRGDGPWWRMSTRRARVASYFVLSMFEREFIAGDNSARPKRSFSA
jgi:hypothetical protein